MPLLEIDNLDAFYGDSHVLHGVTLSVAPGEGLALLGRNGAGKTTLLKSVMAAGPRAEGGLAFEGRKLDGVATHRRARMGISLIPEDRRIFPHISVLTNLKLAQSATREGASPLSPAEVTALFPMLDGLLERKGQALSGGQQQMVAIARGLVARPKLVLLDEPAEGLAPVIVEELAEQIDRSRKQEGYALILTEQNVEFARQCTDRVAILETGRLVFTGDWAEFDKDPELLSHVAL
jgi:ABC-type branched-subunit amino acid transport system ATPase component